MISKTAMGVAILVLATGTAFAAKNQPMQATFADSVAAKTSTVVLADIAWRCEGTSCVSASDPNKASDLRACKSLSHRFGAVKAFSSASGELNAEKLAKCNEGAK